MISKGGTASRHSTKYHVPCSKYQVPSSKAQVAGQAIGSVVISDGKGSRTAATYSHQVIACCLCYQVTNQTTRNIMDWAHPLGLLAAGGSCEMLKNDPPLNDSRQRGGPTREQIKTLAGVIEVTSVKNILCGGREEGV